MPTPQPNYHLRTMMGNPPRDDDKLHECVTTVLGINVVRKVHTPGSRAPFDYLRQSFFEQPNAGDPLVWACRGGGKTMLGAAATLLDLIYKPGIEVRVLGGSMEQSRKMYEHLLYLLDQPLIRGSAPDGYSAVLATAPTQRRLLLGNGSRVELLAQSPTSVRGTRVHKLRCDEVDEFDPDIWRAAQLVTRSGRCGDHIVRGQVDALSTMHKPFGLMSQLTRDAGSGVGTSVPMSEVQVVSNRTVFKWTAMDVIERCPEEKECAACVLWEDCQGRAKHTDGHVRIDDLVAQWHRSSRATWDAEVMCRRPSVRDSVYPMFSVEQHVAAPPPFAINDTTRAAAGMDFGIRSPTVWLWALLSPGNAQVHIVDEYLDAGRTLEAHLDAIDAQGRARQHPRPSFVAIDPAGVARNGQTGRSDADLLRKRGYRVVARPTRIRLGIDRVRARLDRGTLTIHPRCTRLLDALQQYHFDPDRPENEAPIKDGPDHAADALRYLITALDHADQRVTVTRWA
ncbi:MAG: hypothetical protein GVY24_03730 [Planctomycetes bacterium]|jgi:hypothetical protein|nr:hypothetical protein [Planctomycetota bacterium]